MSFPVLRVNALLFWGVLGWFSFLVSCSEKPSRTEKERADSLILYEMREKVKSVSGCKPDSGSCTYIRLAYPRFEGAASPLADSLNQLIAQTFHASRVNETVLDSIADQFLKEYQTHLDNFQGKEISSWNVDIGLRVIRLNKKWICLEEASFGYTGGAHDFGTSQYHTLDISTGRHLRLGDFFDSTGLQKLTRLGEKYFCMARGIKDNQTWEEAGFTFENDQFYLPDNFCFQEDGLRFIFNSYEIGPYVMGATEFLVPAHEIVPFMKKEKNTQPANP